MDIPSGARIPAGALDATYASSGHLGTSFMALQRFSNYIRRTSPKFKHKRNQSSGSISGGAK